MKNICRLLYSSIFALTTTWAGAAVGPYSSLVVFGDSLSDSGNNSVVFGNNTAQVNSITNSYIPGQTYGSGTYSNGQVWATQFASLIGVQLTPSLLGGTNYAFGGSVTGFDQTYSVPPPTGSVTLPGLGSQVGSFLASVGGVVSPNGLFVVAGGGNDARATLGAIGLGGDPGQLTASTASSYAANVGNMVDALQAAGAQHITVWDTPNIGIVPAVLDAGAGASFLGTAIANAMNAALAVRLRGEAGVQTFDIFGLPALVAAHGFANLVDACGNPSLACSNDLAHSLYYDGIHPTTATHSFIASQLFALATPVPEPSGLAMMLAGLIVVVGFLRRKA